MLLRQRIGLLSLVSRASTNASISAPAVALGVFNSMNLAELDDKRKLNMSVVMSSAGSVGISIGLNNLGSLGSSFPSSLREFIGKLFPSIVFALPKKRTSHKVKRIRNGHKQLKNIKHFQTCPKCQGRHLLHHLCPWCFPFNKFLAKKGDLQPKNLA